MMPDGSLNRDYRHDHVFRAAVNGLWGEAVTLGEGETRTFSHTIDIPADWQPRQLSVVAFAYNADGVAQAKEHPVTSK